MNSSRVPDQSVSPVSAACCLACSSHWHCLCPGLQGNASQSIINLRQTQTKNDFFVCVCCAVHSFSVTESACVHSARQKQRQQHTPQQWQQKCTKMTDEKRVWKMKANKRKKKKMQNNECEFFLPLGGRVFC